MASAAAAAVVGEEEGVEWDHITERESGMDGWMARGAHTVACRARVCVAPSGPPTTRALITHLSLPVLSVSPWGQRVCATAASPCTQSKREYRKGDWQGTGHARCAVGRS